MGNLNTTLILTGILVYIGNSLKRLPEYLLNIIKGRFGVSMSCDDRSNFSFYNKIDDWIISFNKKSIMNHTTLKEVYDNNMWKQLYSVGMGTYIFINNKKLFVINKTKENKNNSSSFVQKINVFILGFGSKSIKANFENNIISQSNNNKIKVEQNDNTKIIDKRDFDSVIVKDKQIIIDFLDRWKSNNKFYTKHFLGHTGIILYGPSGTGKSSLIRCIASYLSKNIIMVDLTKSVSELSNDLCNLKEGSVVVFEDIDCVMNIDRENKKEEKNEKRKKLQLLLNTLDGLISPQNTVFIATTNHIRDLDEALIRPGRFDLVFEVPYFEKEQAIEMCDLFETDYSILNGLTFPIKPALLQSIILSKILRGDINE